jgi:hypothetical protein
MRNLTEHRTGASYSVLDELTDRQVEMLVFFAGISVMPPKGAVPATIRALAWRGLIEQVPGDRNRWHATTSGRKALEGLPNLEPGDVYSVAHGPRDRD